MENIASFFGGIIALAALGLLLFFELSMESVFFVYVIYALIIIVAGALVISIRGSIAALIRALTGRAGRIKPSHREAPQGKGIEGGRKIERFFKSSKPPTQEPKSPEKVKNPLLKNMMEKLKEKEEKPGRKSRFSGLAKRLRGIRIPRPKLPKIRIKKPGKPKKKPPKEKPRPVIEERPKRAEKSMLEKIKKGLPKISRPKFLVKPKAAGKPEPEKPVKEEPKEGKKPEKPKPGEPREIPPAKPKPITKEPETSSGSCQICGSSKGLKMHYIVPLEKGGTRD